MKYDINKTKCWYDSEGKIVCTSSIDTYEVLTKLLQDCRTWHEVLKVVKYNKEAVMVCKEHIKRGFE